MVAVRRNYFAGEFLLVIILVTSLTLGVTPALCV